MTFLNYPLWAIFTVNLNDHKLLVQQKSKSKQDTFHIKWTIFLMNNYLQVETCSAQPTRKTLTIILFHKPGHSKKYIVLNFSIERDSSLFSVFSLYLQTPAKCLVCNRKPKKYNIPASLQKTLLANVSNCAYVSLMESNH